MSLFRGHSVRAHIVAIVLVGAIVPLTLIGVWLTTNAVRSGTDLLREQLDSSLGSIAGSIAERWRYRQSEVLLLADNLAARDIVGATATHAPTAEDSAYLAKSFGQVSRAIPAFTYRNAGGREVWTSPVAGDGGPAGAPRQSAPVPTIAAVSPTHDARGRTIGRLEARLAVDGLITADSGRLAVPGGILAIRDVANGVMLTPGMAATLSRATGQMRLHDTTWLVARRTLAQPNLELIAAAPTTAYVAPFEAAARIGFGAVLLVAIAALCLTAYLTSRVTRPLEDLAEASSAVSQGDLDRRVNVAPGHPREVERLATAFNLMTENLNRTMRELSRRSALAAVGEFAASLAHEVRNSLTSVKVDLQRAEEKLPPDAVSRDLVSRSLDTVMSLDSTMTGALRVARSGSVSRSQLDLAGVIRAAADRAWPSFAVNDASLEVGGATSASSRLTVAGDAAALEQLFLNILINAAQALPAGGRATVTARPEDRHVIIAVSDDGGGIAPSELHRVFEPFFTTRARGTGLGLPIARQIAVAHGGELTLDSRIGVGTTVTVRLPSGT